MLIILYRRKNPPHSQSLYFWKNFKKPQRIKYELYMYFTKEEEYRHLFEDDQKQFVLSNSILSPSAFLMECQYLSRLELIEQSVFSLEEGHSNVPSVIKICSSESIFDSDLGVLLYFYYPL
jgi:hypothetical protein